MNMLVKMLMKINKMFNNRKINLSNMLFIVFILFFMSNLKVLSWNVRGIMSSTVCLSELICKTNCDICVISEHKLKEKSLRYLSTIEKGYNCISKADILCDNYAAYHGKGGIAILYKDSLQFNVVELLDIASTRIIGIELKNQSNKSLFILGTYLPSDESIDNYKNELNILESVYTYYSNYGNVIISGDLNASLLSKDIGKTNQFKSKELLKFVQRNHLMYAGGKINNIGPCYTYITKQTMLDYVLVNSVAARSLDSYEILAEGSIGSTSDHLPVVVNISMEHDPHLILNSNFKFPSWHKVTDTQLHTYQEVLKAPVESLLGEMATSLSTDTVYQELMTILHNAADIAIPKCGYNPHTKPYWNTEVKHAHDNERKLRTIWVTEGRPRGMQHKSYREYKAAKTQFRRAQQTANEQYLQKCYDDLNEAAECDIRLFWKLSKQFKKRTSKVYPEIIFKDKVHNRPESIANCFADYFYELYQPNNDDSFDCENKKSVDEIYSDIFQTCITDTGFLPGGVIRELEVKNIVKQLKPRKAAGHDNIQHEHLRHGGESVVKVLTALFNMIVETGSIPNQWKLGYIVPIFKGGSKDKTLPDSYRPISLLSCVYKVFENIIKDRVLQYVLNRTSFPSTQQQGFQKSLSCLTASFNLHESIFHNLEMCSKVYVAFLDSRKAFDTVWRIALMYKLFQLGIKGKLWVLINDCHIDTKSAVVVNQCTSNFFSVTEGVRQGGVLSGLLYLVYINELLLQIENYNKNIGIYNITSCCPALADDISCLSTTPTGLQRMLDICTEYAKKWRFCFNAQKSGIVQFALNNRQPQITFPWHIGRDVLPLWENYSHLGIELDSTFKEKNRIETACRKGRNSFFALDSIISKQTHPTVLLKLYKTVIMPSVLYGCEMWCNLKSKDIQMLNQFQHFIVKRILDLKTSTRSDMCQSIVGLHPITSVIDKKKLYFLQKLCSLNDNYLTKRIFLVRLFSFFIDSGRKHYGFIPDIMNILFRYGLHSYLLDFILECTFPEKNTWKLIVQSSVDKICSDEWQVRISNDSDFIRFKNIHKEVILAKFWTLANTSVEIKNSYMITKLFTDIPNSTENNCSLCNRFYRDLYVHICCSCPGTMILQDTWWDIIIENFPLELFVELYEKDDDDLYQILLGGNDSMDDEDSMKFINLNHFHIIQCIAAYNRALKVSDLQRTFA